MLRCMAVSFLSLLFTAFCRGVTMKLTEANRLVCSANEITAALAIRTLRRALFIFLHGLHCAVHSLPYLTVSGKNSDISLARTLPRTQVITAQLGEVRLQRCIWYIICGGEWEFDVHSNLVLTVEINIDSDKSNIWLAQKFQIPKRIIRAFKPTIIATIFTCHLVPF